MGLAAACLSVCENCAIVPFERVFNDLKGCRCVHFLLLGSLIEYLIKAECFVLLGHLFLFTSLPSPSFDQRNLSDVFVDGDPSRLVLACFDFPFDKGTAAHNDFDTLYTLLLLGVLLL